MGNIYKFNYRPLKHKGNDNTSNKVLTYKGFIEKVWEANNKSKIMTIGAENIHNEVDYRNFNVDRIESMEKIS